MEHDSNSQGGLLQKSGTSSGEGHLDCELLALNVMAGSDKSRVRMVSKGKIERTRYDSARVSHVQATLRRSSVL